jgi:hypothetical protein
VEGSSVDNGIVLLSVSSSWMDILEVLASGMTRSGGGLGQDLLQLLELYGCRQSISYLATLLIAVKSPLDISPDGDDTTRPQHLQNHVGIMCDCHELGECWPSQQSIVCTLKIGDLKLYSLRTEIFLSPKGYGKRNLTDGGCYYTRDYAMEWSPTGVQQRPG